MPLSVMGRGTQTHVVFAWMAGTSPIGAKIRTQ